jgi:hypothetical protein
MTSPLQIGNPASARKYLPAGIVRSVSRASSYMVESDADPSHPLKIYLKMRSKSQIARQFCVVPPLRSRVADCSSFGGEQSKCVPSMAPMASSKKEENFELFLIKGAMGSWADGSLTYFV